jgi:DNA-binding NtrC family response regulator
MKSASQAATNSAGQELDPKLQAAPHASVASLRPLLDELLSGHGVPALATLLVGHPLAEIERELIVATVHECGGNRTHAAAKLGISLRTIRNKLNTYKAPSALAARGSS